MSELLLYTTGVKTRHVFSYLHSIYTSICSQDNPTSIRGGAGGSEGGVRGEKTQGEREEIKEKRGGRDVGMNQNSC